MNKQRLNTEFFELVLTFIHVNYDAPIPVNLTTTELASAKSHHASY